jgi:hypothetical protein
MRTTQEILVLASEKGYYGHSGGTSWMCHSLSEMQKDNLLHPQEVAQVTTEVMGFLSGEYTFQNMLKEVSGLYLKYKDTAEIRQNIYDNWEDRHQLLKEWLELIQIYREFSESSSIPIVEMHPDVVVVIDITPTSVEFEFDPQGLPVWMDEEFTPVSCGHYRAPLTDFMGWSLQQVLEHIHDNIVEGFLLPNNLEDSPE